MNKQIIKETYKEHKRKEKAKATFFVGRRQHVLSTSRPKKLNGKVHRPESPPNDLETLKSKDRPSKHRKRKRHKQNEHYHD
jgi:hypothetical protein